MEQMPYLLIADDDQEDQEMLVSRFQSRNPSVSVKCIDNGFFTLSWLEDLQDEELPRLIVVDYKMPGLTGADVLKCLQDDRYNGITKVVWSTSNSQQYITECFEKGAVKYFTKPSNGKEFDSLVDYLSTYFK